jgi:hypothetical protein
MTKKFTPYLPHFLLLPFLQAEGIKFPNRSERAKIVHQHKRESFE